MEDDMRTRQLMMPLLVALMLLPAAALAQEELSAERPDPGFRVLGPRTVVSFVRQSFPEPGPVPTDDPSVPLPGPRWTTVMHVSNTGNARLGVVAIFVSEDGKPLGHVRFRLEPGRTVSVPAWAMLENALDDPAVQAVAPLARGIVIVRFFTPSDAELGSRFAHMVTAETVLEIPELPPTIFPLDVEQPQPLFGARRLRR
jgi:hypothetical protein